MGQKSQSGKTKKGRRKMSNLKRGKYRKAFIRTVTRTGKWRGKPADLSQAYTGAIGKIKGED